MMPNYVVKLSALGVYGRFDLEQHFQHGVNIIYGKNGSGKTTFLHILANVLNADYERFAYLNFTLVEVTFSDGKIVVIRKEPNDQSSTITVTINNELISTIDETEIRHQQKRRLLRTPQGRLYEDSARDKDQVPFLSADYFPAFRTMIEAWASMEEESTPSRHRPSNRQITATRLARELFGKFVPQINYPSPLDIEHRLSEEVRNAIVNISLGDQELLSRAFLEIFAAMFSDTKGSAETPETVLEQIRSLSENLEASPVSAGFFATPTSIYDELKRSIDSLTVHALDQSVARILDVYRNTLAKRMRVQKTAFIGINRYLDSVNEFLDGKQLMTQLKGETIHLENLVSIVFNDGHTTGLETLSSGERQIVTLLYAATHMNKQRVVLIDEPELSLHVDWQRMLLSKMSEQLQDRQIIACTHSPVIAADYKGHLKELTLSSRTSHDQNVDQTLR
jgi:ABC-type lipoprotein export system ATPase subunit